MWQRIVVGVGFVLFAASAQSFAQQVIVIRTGQSSGGPGTCGDPDDCFRYVATPGCATPLSSSPFGTADFAAARSGQPARVIDPLTPPWIPSLMCDPQARWINSELLPGSCLGNPHSVLYACEFTVASPCPPTARVDACWSSDDTLGDPTGPNPIGVYIGPVSNTIPLNASFSGGNFTIESTASQSNVPLAVGSNWLYVYQRDIACAVSGLILHATITVDPCTTPVGGTTWGKIKAVF